MTDTTTSRPDTLDDAVFPPSGGARADATLHSARQETLILGITAGGCGWMLRDRIYSNEPHHPDPIWNRQTGAPRGLTPSSRTPDSLRAANPPSRTPDDLSPIDWDRLSCSEVSEPHLEPVPGATDPVAIDDSAELDAAAEGGVS